MYMCVPMSVCHTCADTCGGRKRESDLSDLDLQVVVSCLTWMLGALGSLEEANLLNH